MAFTVAKNAWCRNIVSGLKFRSVNSPGVGASDFAIDEYNRLWVWGGNADGSAAVGNPKYDLAASPRQTVYENYRIVVPRLVDLADGTVKEDWKKVQNCYSSTQALDKEGRLWSAGLAYGESGNSCATFGLPHDSGEDYLAWKVGVSPREDYQTSFFHFTRSAPSDLFNDFANHWYFSVLIGQDKKLYFLGVDDTYGLSGEPIGTGPYTYYVRNTPTRVTNIDDDIKFLAHPGRYYLPDMYAFVTTDNKVYGVGEGIWSNFDPDSGSFDFATDPVIYELTRNLPSVDIVDLSIGYNLFVTLADGTVYGMGSGFMFPDGVNSLYEWKKIDVSNIVQCRQSTNGVYTLDHEGKVFSWGNCYYGRGLQVANCRLAYPTGVERTTDKLWLSIQYNDDHESWVGVDRSGNLYAWGRQYYAPHLGIGTDYSDTLNGYNGITLDPVEEVCTPVLCTISPQKTVAFHWPRAVPTPTPDYHDRS